MAANFYSSQAQRVGIASVDPQTPANRRAKPLWPPDCETHILRGPPLSFHFRMILSSTNCWRPLFRRWTLALLLALAVLPTGCVRRRLAVRSNPPGALVFVDNQQIGTTPCSVDFTYYGTREIRLVKPGFETLTVNQPIPTPWYQFPPLDFVSENLMPNKIQDHRTVAFNLEPQLIVPTEQLLDRANQLRQESQQSVSAPPPSFQAAPTPVIQAAPTPSYAMPPGPTPLPPVTQAAPPGAYSPPATVPNSPYTSPTFAPGAAAPAPAPFSPPAMPSTPPGSTQQGPPLVSPPLR